MAGNCKPATELQISKSMWEMRRVHTAKASVLALLIYHCMDLGLYCSNLPLVSQVLTLITGLSEDLLGPVTALRHYCISALGLSYMLKQLLSSSLMEVMKQGCPGNVESGETSLS